MLLSYIYPPMFGYGNVYDLPQPKIGDCWLSVHWGNDTDTLIGLVAQPESSVRMNKFHVNFPGDAIPRNVEIMCPTPGQYTGGMYMAWIKERFDRRYITAPKIDELEAGQTVKGRDDALYYDYLPDTREFFRGRTEYYDHRPVSQTSDDTWEYLGNDIGLFKIFRNNHPYDGLGRNSLASRNLQAPEQQLLPSQVFGKGEGTLDFIDHVPGFDKNTEIKGVYQGVTEFGAMLSKYYGHGKVMPWQGSRMGEVGDLYVYHNPYKGTLDYFLLRSPSYGYFPSNQASRDMWRYLGSGDSYIRYEPNPLTFDRADNGKSIDQRVMEYYGVDRLFTWGERTKTERHGEVFAYDNPWSGRREYFMQHHGGQGGFFPTNETSNQYWKYLANELDLRHLVYSADLRQGDSFDALVARWYGQDYLNE